MGQRGPAPKPSSLVLLEGNTGKRPVNSKEPKAARKRPVMPADLDEVAQREWKRLCPILEKMKVLTEADATALGTLCQVTSMKIALQEELRDAGLTYMTETTGVPHVSPIIVALTACREQETRLLREFGLTPASRSRLVTDDSGKQQNGGLLNGQWRAKA